jgi:hypothetical protein
MPEFPEAVRIVLQVLDRYNKSWAHLIGQNITTELANSLVD